MIHGAFPKPVLRHSINHSCGARTPGDKSGKVDVCQQGENDVRVSGSTSQAHHYDLEAPSKKTNPCGNAQPPDCKPDLFNECDAYGSVIVGG